MAEVWDAKGAVEDTAKDLLGKYHPEVAAASFGWIFKDKASLAEMEAGIVATAKKVPPVYKLLSKDDLDFVIIISKPLWDELSPAEQVAHLDSALCSCTAKVDEDGEFKVDDAGNPIFCLRQFDLQGHSEVLARYGIDAFAEVGSRIKAALGKTDDGTDGDPAED
jgi:hypothetical protein